MIAGDSRRLHRTGRSTAPFILVAEVAATLKLSRGRVYALIAEGGIPAVRSGRRVRIPRAAFERWLEDQAELALANLREPRTISQEILRPEDLQTIAAGMTSRDEGK